MIISVVSLVLVEGLAQFSFTLSAITAMANSVYIKLKGGACSQGCKIILIVQLVISGIDTPLILPQL